MKITKKLFGKQKMLCERTFFSKKLQTLQKKLSSIRARFQANNFPHFEAQAFQ